MRRKTKIIATLGPATDSPEDIGELIEYGMDVARLNFSHGEHAEHERRFNWVRQAADHLQVPLAIMQDIQGPKIRVGTFPEGTMKLESGDEVVLKSGDGEAPPGYICVAYLEDIGLEPGVSVVMADGLITLEALSGAGEEVRARVVQGGELGDHKGVNFPGCPVDVPALTEKDVADLTFGLELGFDFIAASFASSADDVREVRKIVGDVPVIAKIESALGYRNLDEILEESDGAMVARGDLGVELSLQSVPRAQTDILSRTNLVGKVSITATEMLESMTTSARPTRAEVTDVYRSVLEGTDAVMLSAETAIGDYPARAVRAMDIICREAEASSDYGRAPELRLRAVSSRFASATSEASVDTADRLGLKTIVAFTESGTTARLLSKYRPHADIYAFTAVDSTYRRMAIYGGVTPLPFERVSSTDQMVAAAEGYLLHKGMVEPGDGVVMVAGIPPNRQASTNLMKLHEIGDTTVGIGGG